MDSFGDLIQETGRRYGVSMGGDVFKFQEGKNQVRVMSRAEAVATHYEGKQKLGVCYGQDKGCPFHGEDYKDAALRLKFACYVLDRADGKVKVAYFPWTIIDAFSKLANDEDWKYDTLPMPYDVVINATNAGTKEVNYNVLPRQPKPLTEAESQLMESLKPIHDIVEAMKAKAKRTAAPIELEEKPKPKAKEAESGDEEEREEVDVETIPF